MKAVIIEDSRLARQELKELLKPFPEIEVLAEATNISDGKNIVEQHMPDVIFLDINMPGGDGFELLESLDSIPSVIFTTAYNEFAVRAFEVNALDYLLKPINPTHLEKALSKLILEIRPEVDAEAVNASLHSNSKIFVREGEDCWLIKIDDVRYFESIGNHTRIYFDNKKPFIYKSLSKVVERLPQEIFFRANRQFIININFIEEVTPSENGRLLLKMIDKKSIEVSRRNAIEFKKLLSL
jgi:two-component system, LytTR family, response regulator